MVSCSQQIVIANPDHAPVTLGSKGAKLAVLSGLVGRHIISGNLVVGNWQI